MPTPNNIEFKDISDVNLFISWKINNDTNIININKNNIKYRVEMKEGKNKFKQVYEGKDYNCKVEQLKPNTNYEFRICSFYEDLFSPWTDIQKVQTITLVDTAILKDDKKKNEFILKLLEWSGFKSMELLYRGSRDGMNESSFHKNCDGKENTITLIQNDKGCIFGGFASLQWGKSGEWKNVPDCFIFTLRNIYGTEPKKFPSKKKGCEVGHFNGYGPLFGDNGDIYFYSNFQDDGNRSPYSRFPISYEDVLGKGKSIFTGDNNNNNIKFKIKEIEVFRLYK